MLIFIYANNIRDDKGDRSEFLPELHGRPSVNPIQELTRIKG